LNVTYTNFKRINKISLICNKRSFSNISKSTKINGILLIGLLSFYEGVFIYCVLLFLN
jgi:hypothetical protein